MSEFNARDAVFTPPETSAFGVEYVQKMEQFKHRAMPLDVPAMGDYLAPLMPGEICAVQAQTSNFKSGWINMWEHSLAAHLASQGRDEVIFHIDTETTIESLAIQEMARFSDHTVADLSRGNVRNWGKVIKAADKIAGIDIYRIGAALGHDNMPDLYLSNIYRALKFATSGELLGRKLKPACIFVDYLQALPIDPEVRQGSDMKSQRRLQVREDVYRLRRMAAHFECPVVVGVQAKQVLSGAPGPNMLIPGMYDGEETSSIAQRFDRIISMWMPKTSHQMGTTIRHGQMEVFVDDDVLFAKVLKQRGGLPAGKSFAFNIDYKRNRLVQQNGGA